MTDPALEYTDSDQNEVRVGVIGLDVQIVDWIQERRIDLSEPIRLIHELNPDRSNKILQRVETRGLVHREPSP